MDVDDLDIVSMPNDRPALSATSELTPVVASDPAPATPDPVPVAPVPDAPEPDGGEPAEPGEGEGEEPVPAAAPKPEKIGARLSEMAAAKRVAEERQAAADARADKLALQVERLVEIVSTGQVKPAEHAQETPPAPKPLRDDFMDPDSYDTALIEWASQTAATAAASRVTAEVERRAAEQRANDQRAADERTQAEALAAQQKQNETVISTWNERRAKAIEAHPDFEDVAEAWNLQVPMTIVPALMAAENGPEVLYHLGKNPAEAERIAGLSQLQQVIEIGKISATLSIPVRAQPSRLPPPISPVGSRNGATSKAPNEMSTEEVAAYLMPKLQAERTAGMWGRTKAS